MLGGKNNDLGEIKVLKTRNKEEDQKSWIKQVK